MIVFFTCKNCLVLVLQIYRLIIIAAASDDDEDEDDEDAKMSIDTIERNVMAMQHTKRYTKREPSSPGVEVPTVSEKVKRGMMKRSQMNLSDKLSYEKDYDKTSTDSYSYHLNDSLPVQSKSSGKTRSYTPSKSLESTDSEYVLKAEKS